MDISFNKCASLKHVDVIFGKYANYFFIWISILLFSIIGILSFFVTVSYPGYGAVGSKYLISMDSAPVVIFGSFIVIAVVVLLNACKVLDRCDARKVLRYLAVYLFFACVGWFVLANTWPDWDSLDLFGAASSLGRDYETFWAPGWYMERYPYQIPYVLFLKVCLYVFGSNAYVAVEIINSICIAASGYLLSKYSLVAFGNRIANVAALLCALFLPSVLYATFAYGNPVSFPFAVGALLLQLYYFNKPTKVKIVYIAVLLTISILLKSTMIVVLFAMCIAWVIVSIKKRRVADIIACIAVFVIYTVCSTGINAAVAKRYNVVTDNGLSKIAWIAMGVRVTQYPSIPDYPGYYDAFVWQWPGKEYNPKVAIQDSKQSLLHTWEVFSSDPRYAFEFMGKKIVMEWTDPSYESLLNSNWAAEGPQKPGIMSHRPMTPMLHSIYYGKLNRVIWAEMDTIQFLTFAGAVFFLLVRRKDTEIESLVPLITCLGVAFIYIFWEAKSQYVMPAAQLLLIYSAPGLCLISDYVLNTYRLIKSRRRAS